MKRKFYLVVVVSIIALLSISTYCYSEAVELSDAQMSEVEGEILFVAAWPGYGTVSGHLDGIAIDTPWAVAVVLSGGTLAVVDNIFTYGGIAYHEIICSGFAGWSVLYASDNNWLGINWWHIRIHDVPGI